MSAFAPGLNRFINGKFRKGGKLHLLKHASMKRPRHMLWEFNDDGRFKRDRIKGFDKRRLRKWLLRKQEEQAFRDW